MAKTFTTFGNSNDDFRRDELVRKIEHALQELTLGELEALYYDMISKDYLRDYSLWLGKRIMRNKYSSV